MWYQGCIFSSIQYVTVGHAHSGCGDIASGVLGPVLFVIFINDTCYLLPVLSTLKLFADDAKLYCTVNSNIESVNLQHSFDIIRHWSNAQQLKLSSTRYTVMHLIPRRAHCVQEYQYTINNDCYL